MLDPRKKGSPRLDKRSGRSWGTRDRIKLNPAIAATAFCLSIFCLIFASQPSDAEEMLTPDAISNPRLEEQFKSKNRIVSNDPFAHFQLGKYYFYHGRYKEAAEAFRQATLLKPDWFEPFFSLGRTYRILDRDLDAERALRKAVALNSRDYMAQHLLGLVYMRSGYYRDAAEALRKAIIINPGWAENYYRENNIFMHGEFEDKSAVLEIVKILRQKDQYAANLLWLRWSRQRDVERMWPKRAQ